MQARIVTDPLPSATLSALTMYHRRFDLRGADFGFKPRDFVVYVSGVGWCDVTKFDQHGVVCMSRPHPHRNSGRGETFRVDMRERKFRKNRFMIDCCLSLKGSSKLRDLFRIPLLPTERLMWFGYGFFVGLNEAIGHDRYWFYTPGLAQTGSTHYLPPFIVMKDEADAVTAVNFVRDFRDLFGTI